MKSVSDARLVVVIVLLMALSAGAMIGLTWAPQSSNLPRPSAQASESLDVGRDNTLTTQQSRLSRFWDRVESGANVEVVLAYGLNLVLTLLVIMLLRRNGRYRQTLFAKAFRSSPLSITISTLSEGRYVDVNHAFLQMLNYERKHVIGRTAAELGIWVDPEDRTRLLEQLNSSSVTRGQHARLRTSSGEVRDVNVTADVIDLDGVRCLLAVTQDVTEAKRLENQLRQAQRMGAVGRLAGGVAHDFNNILTVIIGYSELAMYRLGSGHSLSAHLGEIKLAAERAASLTRQLLAFSRQQVLFPRILDLNAVLTNLTQMLLRMIGDDISLSFKPDSELGYIKADLGQMEQIVMNLVVNARDAMPHGGAVAIATSRLALEDGYTDSHVSVKPGRYVVLSVSDTGCGMDEKTVSHIFEPFYTTKAPGQGTGMGLSTVYGIVKQSDGYIWVYSEVGRGTTFKLYFPEHPRGAQKPADAAPVLDLAIGTETILVVEDDDALRRIITTLIESAGYRVLQAASAESAIALAQSPDEHIDLLLTDVLMPITSGVELSSQLKKILPDLKVLLMSGFAGDLIARYRATEPDIMLIEKPFTRHGLLAKIRTVL